MQETYVGCDLDGTIYRGNCSIDFFLVCMRKTQGLNMFFLKHLGNYIKYLLRFHDFHENTEKFYRFTPELENPEQLIQEFWDKNIRKIKKWFYSLHMENVLIVSASADFLIKALQERLNFAGYVATQVDLKTGAVKGGRTCIGKEKLKRFQQEKPEARLEAFYSDSKKDRPMASAAKVSYKVKRNSIKIWKTRNRAGR